MGSASKTVCLDDVGNNVNVIQDGKASHVTKTLTTAEEKSTENDPVNIDALIWVDITDVFAKKDSNLNRTNELAKEFCPNVILRALETDIITLEH